MQVPKTLFRPYIGIIPSPLGQEAGATSQCQLCFSAGLQRGSEEAFFLLNDNGNSYAGRNVVTSAIIYRETQDSLSEKKCAGGCLITRNVQGVCITH